MQLGRDEQERTEVCMTFPLTNGLHEGASANLSAENGSAAAGHEGGLRILGGRGSAAARQDDRIDPTSPT